MKGEDKWQCIEREMLEETGLSCHEFEEIGCTLEERKQAFFHVFVCTVDCDKDSVHLQEGETAQSHVIPTWHPEVRVFAVSDDRTGYLPQELVDALLGSDALALECDTEAFDELVEEDEKLQDKISDYYYYSNGKTAADYLDEETYALAVKYMKASGNYTMNSPYLKLSMWANAIENFQMRIGHFVTGDQGVEERLVKLAKEQEKKILEVESNEFQIKMLTSWSDDLQVLLLEDALEYPAEEYWEGLQELYELWCAGDEEAMRKELSDEVDTSEFTEEELAEYEASKHLVEEYNKAMSYDRNDGMLEVAIEYLESGETVFYAVGLAHLLNDVNGLVDTLREAGYTVELVSYSE